MREIICLSTPAILMVLLVHILGKRKLKISELISQFVIYMALNNVCVISLLGLVDKVVLTLGEHGEMHLFYGGVAILTSMVVAVVLSFLIVGANKNLRISLKIREGIEVKNV